MEMRRSDLLDAARAAPRPVKSAIERLKRCWESEVGEQVDSYRVLEPMPQKLLDALAGVVAAAAKGTRTFPRKSPREPVLNFVCEA